MLQASSSTLMTSLNLSGYFQRAVATVIAMDSRATNCVSPSPGISETIGVLGGKACIAGTGIPVWGVVARSRLGMSEAKIARALGLRKCQVKAAMNYFRLNQDKIERDIREVEEATNA